MGDEKDQDAVQQDDKKDPPDTSWTESATLRKEITGDRETKDSGK